MKKSESVPKSMRARYEEIISITGSFSKKHLNDEYAQEIKYAVAFLCRKRPSPLEKGKALTWACGVTHAIGMINFLFDQDQTPYIRASDLYSEFGVSESAGQGKSKIIRDILKMYQCDPNWTIPSQLSSNPMIWLISVNGLFVDARYVPREIQEIAFEKGLIPYIPE